MTSNQTPAGWRDMKDAPKDKEVWLIGGMQTDTRLSWPMDLPEPVSEPTLAQLVHGEWVVFDFDNGERIYITDPAGWLPQIIPDPTTGFAPVVTEEMVRLRNVAKAAEGVVAEWDEYNQPDVDAVGICHSAPSPQPSAHRKERVMRKKSFNSSSTFEEKDNL
jgi:hypothetical protein